MDDLDLSAVSNFDVNRDKLLRHVAIGFLGFFHFWVSTRHGPAKNEKIENVWLSCAHQEQNFWGRFQPSIITFQAIFNHLSSHFRLMPSPARYLRQRKRFLLLSAPSLASPRCKPSSTGTHKASVNPGMCSKANIASSMKMFSSLFAIIYSFKKVNTTNSALPRCKNLCLLLSCGVWFMCLSSLSYSGVS